MNLVTVKDIKKVKLDGIKIEWIKEDGRCYEMRLMDTKGNAVVIRSAGSYSDYLKVLEVGPEDASS